MQRHRVTTKGIEMKSDLVCLIHQQECREHCQAIWRRRRKERIRMRGKSQGQGFPLKDSSSRTIA